MRAHTHVILCVGVRAPSTVCVSDFKRDFFSTLPGSVVMCVASGGRVGGSVARSLDYGTV